MSQGASRQMDGKAVAMEEVSQKMAMLETKMVELRFLRRVALDLRSYRRMIGIKNFD